MIIQWLNLERGSFHPGKFQFILLAQRAPLERLYPYLFGRFHAQKICALASPWNLSEKFEIRVWIKTLLHYSSAQIFSHFWTFKLQPPKTMVAAPSRLVRAAVRCLTRSKNSLVRVPLMMLIPKESENQIPLLCHLWSPRKFPQVRRWD
jgi:hypothetical protein